MDPTTADRMYIFFAPSPAVTGSNNMYILSAVVKAILHWESQRGFEMFVALSFLDW